MAEEVIINGDAYSLYYSYGAIRAVGKAMGYKSIAETLQQFQALDGVNGEGLSFEQEEMLATLIQKGIEHGTPELKNVPSADQIIEAFMVSPVILENAVAAFAAAFPVAEDHDHNTKKKLKAVT